MRFKGGEQKTTMTFDPAREQLLGQIFGTPGNPLVGGQVMLPGMGMRSWTVPGTPGIPGTGLTPEGLSQIFGPAATPLQRQATNQFSQSGT
jgi:hypothetical protein